MLAPLFTLLAASAPQPALPTLTNLAQVRAVSAEQAATGLPVQVQATVTYCDPGWKVLFIQDGNESVFVENANVPNDPLWTLKRGQLVEFEGETRPGMVHRNILGKGVRVVGTGKLPGALELTGGKPFKDENDARPVKIAGWVGSLTWSEHRAMMELVTAPGQQLLLIVPEAPRATMEALRGCWVEASGIFGIGVDGNGKRNGGYVLFAPGFQAIKKRQELPLRSVGEVRQLGGPVREPFRLRGKAVRSGSEDFFVRDEIGRLRVELRTVPNFNNEELVEVRGYLGAGPKGLVLTQAFVQALGPAQVPAAAAAPAVTTPTAANTNLTVLTEVIQVRDLAPQEAARGYPVRVTGVITFCDEASNLTFVQDDSAGIYLNHTQLEGAETAQFRHGQKVEVVGFSGPGDYAPVILATQVRPLGKAPLPPAKPVSAQLLMTGAEDSQWVVLKGVVRSRVVETNQTVLELLTGDASLRVILPETRQAPVAEGLVDATVEVVGVCATVFDERRRLQGAELHVPGWAQISVKEAALADPFKLPVERVEKLFQFHPGTSGLHRTHLRGHVILTQADGSFFIQDSTGGLHIRPKAAPEALQVGQVMDVVGFPMRADKLPVLQDAVVEPLERGFQPDRLPARLDPERALNEDLHATLVRLEGRVVDHALRPNRESLTVQFGPRLIDATLEKTRGRLVDLAPGTVVQLAGVYAARLDEMRNVQAFQLLLRSPQDVVVLSRPGWWTVRHTFLVLGGAGTALLLVLGWVGSLRKQVQQRTQELREEIEEHKRSEQQLKTTQGELLRTSRLAGMAEVATSVLHNVGNVLNSINVSASLAADQLQRSKVPNVGRAAALMREHAAQLGEFLTQDPRGKQLPAYLSQLAEHLQQEQASLASELESLKHNVEHVKDIVSMQQNYAKVTGVTETLQVTDLVEDALRMHAGALMRHDVQIVRDYCPKLPNLTVDKNKVLQILVNLIHNAKYACDESGRNDKQVTVRVSNGEGHIRIGVMDNGIGIPPENLTRIFNHGFTTRKNGHGFGLHSGALAAKEMGGALRVQSEGVGKGAVFTLELPVTAAARPEEAEGKESRSPQSETTPQQA
ncbi:MAG TPA: ATP-binding protein [Bacillota bacterium]|nr:ATP-binding protein [Bacillota bacterium]